MDYEVPKYSMEGQLFVVKKKSIKIWRRFVDW